MGIKRTVDDKVARKLLEAHQALLDAEDEVDRLREERDRLVLDAMKAGGSYREVAKVLHVSVNAVRTIALKQGWAQTPEKQARDEEAAEASRQAQAWRERSDDAGHFRDT